MVGRGGTTVGGGKRGRWVRKEGRGRRNGEEEKEQGRRENITCLPFFFPFFIFLILKIHAWLFLFLLI